MSWSLSADAAPIKVGYVPLTPLDEASQAASGALDRALLAELGERRELAVLPVEPESGPSLALSTIGYDPQKPLDDAERLIAQGKFDAALKILRRVINAMEQRPASADLSKLGRAELLLSVAYFRRGSEDEGQRALDEFVRVRPDIELGAPAYPPLFLRLHQRTVKKWQERSMGELLIEASGDATVSLNGRLLGEPPVTVSEVPAGRHLVAITWRGKQSVRAIDLLGTQRQVVSFDTSSTGGSRGPLARNRLDRPAKRALAALASANGAGFVIAGAVVKQAGELRVRLAMIDGSGEGGTIGEWSIDSDLLSASIEAGKVADRIVQALAHPPEGATAKSEGGEAWFEGAASGLRAERSAPLLVHYFTGISPPVAPEPPRVVVKNEQPTVAPQGEQLSSKPEAPAEPETPASEQPKTITAAPVDELPPARTYSGLKPAPMRAPDTETKLRTPIYERWWLWTLLGVAAAGGATAIALVATARVNQVTVHASWR